MLPAWYCNEWLDPFPESSTPIYMTGEYPSDYGWDTAGLGADQTTLEAELIHARWAMLGTPGCLTPEILAKYFGAQSGEPIRSKAGTQTLQEGGLSCFGNPSLIHAKPVLAILPYQVLLMGAGEAYCINQEGLANDSKTGQPGATSVGWTGGGAAASNAPAGWGGVGCVHTHAALVGPASSLTGRLWRGDAIPEPTPGAVQRWRQPELLLVHRAAESAPVEWPRAAIQGRGR